MINNVCVSWIDGGMVHSRFMKSVIKLLNNERVNNYVSQTGVLVSFNRNKVVEQFLNTDSEWLLMLDSDVIVSSDNFDRLLRDAEISGAKIISGSYFLFVQNKTIAIAAKEEDSYGYIKWLQYEDEGIFNNAHSVGTGYLLVHREIFEKIKESSNSTYPWFYDGPMEDATPAWIGEDSAFCEKVKEQGYNIFVSFNAKSLHLKTIPLSHDILIEYPR